MSESPELSVVMPCLNEADTVGICVEKAVRAMREHGVDGEVVLADNGSTDTSKQIAESMGARTVDVTEPGYGAALMGGDMELPDDFPFPFSGGGGSGRIWGVWVWLGFRRRSGSRGRPPKF